MCLAVPARVEQINGSIARVNLAGNTLQTSIDLLNDVKVGDYVLVHAGYALQKIDEEEAIKTLEIIELLGLSAEESHN